MRCRWCGDEFLNQSYPSGQSHESRCKRGVELRDQFAIAALAGGYIGLSTKSTPEAIWEAVDEVLEKRGNPYEQ